MFVSRCRCIVSAARSSGDQQRLLRDLINSGINPLTSDISLKNWPIDAGMEATASAVAEVLGFFKTQTLV